MFIDRTPDGDIYVWQTHADTAHVATVPVFAKVSIFKKTILITMHDCIPMLISILISIPMLDGEKLINLTVNVTNSYSHEIKDVNNLSPTVLPTPKASSKLMFHLIVV